MIDSSDQLTDCLKGQALAWTIFLYCTLSFTCLYVLFALTVCLCFTCVLCVFVYILLGVNSMEVKTEVDSNDATECLHDDKPTIGMFG